MFEMDEENETKSKLGAGMSGEQPRTCSRVLRLGHGTAL